MNSEDDMSKEEFVKQLKSNGYKAFLSNGTAYVTCIPDNIEKVTGEIKEIASNLEYDDSWGITIVSKTEQALE